MIFTANVPMPEKFKFTQAIIKEENRYVSHCVELGVVSQGKTIEESKANLKEAVELYLESFGKGSVHEMVRPLL